MMDFIGSDKLSFRTDVLIDHHELFDYSRSNDAKKISSKNVL